MFPTKAQPLTYLNEINFHQPFDVEASVFIFVFYENHERL